MREGRGGEGREGRGGEGGGEGGEGGGEGERVMINVAQAVIRCSHKIWVTENWTDSP